MVEGRTHRPVIEAEHCRSCNVCLRGCPAELFPEYRLGPLYQGADRSLSLKEKVPLPPCQEACPIHEDTRGYVSLISKGKLKEALELIREVNPLPAVCGYICHHLCEEACLRTEVDRPISLRVLKRFVAEYEQDGPIRRKPPKKKRAGRILVVGSGPAGLAAANDLCLLGYRVTLLEALPLFGGMLAIGIPEFRLPREVLEIEIDGIRDRGVEMKANQPFLSHNKGTTVQQLGFDALFLATGAHRSVKLDVEGSNLRGVLSGLDFLRDIHLGRKVPVGNKVLVVGGGNVAVDVARTAYRLGATEVQMVCIESRREMPAIPEEVGEASREGVEIHTDAAPVKILGRGEKAVGLMFRSVGSEGKGSLFKIMADTIIAAIGQRVGKHPLQGLETHSDGRIRIDAHTGATSLRGVYAGGDVVTGPGWAIDAIAAGKRGAEAIHRYLA